jgi:hypothetical protein
MGVIRTRGLKRFVDLARKGLRSQLIQVLAGGPGEELRPADTQLGRTLPDLVEDFIRNRNRGLHDLSITGYYQSCARRSSGRGPRVERWLVLLPGVGRGPDRDTAGLAGIASGW